MEHNVSNRAVVVSQGLVWGALQVQVEPANSAIVGTNNNIVTLRVDADTGVDLGTTDEFFAHCLNLI
jgi:hypothetical protein